MLETLLSLAKRFQNMDRRFVFLGMALAIVGPLIWPINLSFEVNKEVVALYEQVEQLEPGDPVLVSTDFDPASKPELGPFFTANLHHMFRNDLRPVFVTLWVTSIPLVLPEIEAVAESYGKEYGKDWAFLGYKPGGDLVIKAIGQNITSMFNKDHYGTDVEDIAVMQGLRQAKDFPLLVSVSAGNPGIENYVLQIQAQYNLNIVGACTAVSGPDTIPFFKSSQLTGLSMGMPGSAQYETMVWDTVTDRYDGQPPEGMKRMATAAMGVLNFGHLFIIVLILLGNLAYFFTRIMGEK